MSHWIAKFAHAFRGIRLGIVGQSSFTVHLTTAALVGIVATVLRCELWQWCMLVLCIALVLGFELLNSAVESLARGLCQEHNEMVGRALDIASGAVLLVSLLTAVVGLLIFAKQLGFWS